ncbi:hypothetical protein Nepgr_006296 [Nepenthes gracilis]|uniref:Uncharacterized protein n=1 Tax=Nepenthes gracilis TaxID=150966 RepID=A0AAD3S5D6_NEPGR|nr:hypothetical protein Nepgr_006296 [Nepenthes gracilis]
MFRVSSHDCRSGFTLTSYYPLDYRSDYLTNHRKCTMQQLTYMKKLEVRLKCLTEAHHPHHHQVNQLEMEPLHTILDVGLHWMLYGRNSGQGKVNIQARPIQRAAPGEPFTQPTGGLSKYFELGFVLEYPNWGSERSKGKRFDSTLTFQNEDFNAFVADCDTSKLKSSACSNKSVTDDCLEAEVVRLEEQLRQANMEKVEITSNMKSLWRYVDLSSKRFRS